MGKWMHTRGSRGGLKEAGRGLRRVGEEGDPRRSRRWFHAWVERITPTPACVILGSAGKVLEGRGSGGLAGGSRREGWSTGQAWVPEFTAERMKQSCAGKKEREVTAPIGGPGLQRGERGDARVGERAVRGEESAGLLRMAWRGGHRP